MDEIDGTMTTLEDRACKLEKELEIVKADLTVSNERNRNLKAESLQLQVCNASSNLIFSWLE